MQNLITKYSRNKLSSIRHPFYSLSKSIVGQQISVLAANAIWSRLENKYDIFSGYVFKKKDIKELRKVGLSGRKAMYLIHLSEALGLNGKWGRSKIELKYIFMNAQTWQYIFEGEPLSIAYEKTAQILSTSIDDVRIGFERKNHDFGTRELSRFGLDIFIVINKRQLTSAEINIADEYLKEDIRIQMSKDLHHHRIKYQ